MLTRNTYKIYAFAAQQPIFRIVNDCSPFWRQRRKIDDMHTSGRFIRRKLSHFKDGYEYEVTDLFWLDIEQKVKPILFKLNQNEALCEQTFLIFQKQHHNWLNNRGKNNGISK